MQETLFDSALLKDCETHWPYPLALTCRALRVKTHWQEAIQAGCHLFELLLKHLLALTWVEYLACAYPSTRISTYLVNQAYRGNLTCGNMLEALRLVVPYLHPYLDRLNLPAWVAAYMAHDQALDRTLLGPLNQMRVKWSHPKGHIAYQAPLKEDFNLFRQALEDLIRALSWMAETHLIFSQTLKVKDRQIWVEAVLLEGPLQPFETAWLPVLEAPESDQVGVYLKHAQKVLPVSPFYQAETLASGHFELRALSKIQKKMCFWEPDWDAPEAQHQAYLDFMGRACLPEKEPLPEQVSPPETVTEQPTDPPPPDERPAPLFRNATWRMFAMDWELKQTVLENHSHYDLLRKGPELLAVWIYVSAEDAYLIGARESTMRMFQYLLPELKRLETGCPESYRGLFVPERQGHWHHNHFEWGYVASQKRLGEALESLDQEMGLPHLTPPPENAAENQEK